MTNKSSDKDDITSYEVNELRTVTISSSKLSTGQNKDSPMNNIKLMTVLCGR